MNVNFLQNDSCAVNVSVEDVNEWEPRFRYPHYEFFVAEQQNDLIGRIEAADGDRNDKLVLTLTGVNASLFFITSNGELRLKELKEYSGVANLAVIATDSGNPPRRASVPVTVHFPGDSSSSGISSGRHNNGGSFLLAGLGIVLLILAFVIAILLFYIYKA